MDTNTAASAITVTVLLAALGLKVTDLVKFATNAAFAGTDKAKRRKAVNDIATFFVGWVVGFFAVLALSRTAWGDEVKIGNEMLSSLNFVNLVMFGLVFSTVAGTLYDFKKAIDNTDTAKKEPLIPGSGG